MKKLTWFMVLLVLSGVVYAQDSEGEIGEIPKFSLFKDEGFYDSLKTVNLVLPWIDYGMMVIGIQAGWIEEANPITRMYVDKPYIAVPINIVTTIGFNVLTNWMWHEGHKGMAIIFQVAKLALNAYIICHNVNAVYGK